MAEHFPGDHCRVGFEVRIKFLEQRFNSPAKVGAAQSEQRGDRLRENGDQQTNARENHHKGNDGVKMLECHREGLPICFGQSERAVRHPVVVHACGQTARLNFSSLFGKAAAKKHAVTFEIQLVFHGGLAGFFLPPRLRRQIPVFRNLREKTSVKDVIEACGVPHPEVDLIVISSLNGEAPGDVDFRWQVETSVRLEVYGFPAPREVLPSAPRLQTPSFDRFVADGHLGKLARNLRLLGFDTIYEAKANDRRLLEITTSEDRAILTRDRRLLMHSIVRHGYCPRSVDPAKQTAEVLRRFGALDPSGQTAPFSRCLECNGLLKSVPKADVLERLADEPLTLRYYDDYRMCSACGRIYWPGTHFDKLASRVSMLIGR